MSLLSAATQLAGAIWQARVQTAWEIIASNALSSVGGAVSETIVQMTVADLFFLHQRATASGVYLVVAAVGAWLAPVAAGYCAMARDSGGSGGGRLSSWLSALWR